MSFICAYKDTHHIRPTVTCDARTDILLFQSDNADFRVALSTGHSSIDEGLWKRNWTANEDSCVHICRSSSSMRHYPQKTNRHSPSIPLV
jgi:hypothetical protein